MKKDYLEELIAKRLSGSINSDEKKELSQLLEDSAARQVYEDFKSKWDHSALYIPDVEIDKELAWQRFQSLINEKSTNPKKDSYRSIIFRAAAAILVGVALGFYFLYPSTALESYATGESETKEIQLSDGSKVFLNELSTLTVSRGFDGTERVVTLEGEGFFDIQRDETKPFTIHSKESTVQVLGTSFNFEAYGGKEYTQVNVVSGKVSLFKRGDKSGEVILTQGMRGIHYLADGRIQSATPQIDNSRAWITRQLVFDDIRMDKVIEDLNKYFNMQFKVENEAILNCRFTSTFEEPTAQQIIDVLSATLDISGREINNTYVLRGQGCTE